MNCIGFAFIIASLTCDVPTPPAPLVTAEPRLCQVMTKPFMYARTDDARTRKQLRSANAIWRATCQDR